MIGELKNREENTRTVFNLLQPEIYSLAVDMVGTSLLNFLSVKRNVFVAGL